MTARVITFNAMGRERTTFEGDEGDAQAYIVNNFPRLHVEPGSRDEPYPDAILDVDGTRTYWDGKEWLDWSPNTGASSEHDERDRVISEQEQQLSDLRAQLEAFQRAQAAPPAAEEVPAEHERQLAELREQFAEFQRTQAAQTAPPAVPVEPPAEPPAEPVEPAEPPTTV